MYIFETNLKIFNDNELFMIMNTNNFENVWFNYTF